MKLIGTWVTIYIYTRLWERDKTNFFFFSSISMYQLLTASSWETDGLDECNRPHPDCSAGEILGSFALYPFIFLLFISFLSYINIESVLLIISGLSHLSGILLGDAERTHYGCHAEPLPNCPSTWAEPLSAFWLQYMPFHAGRNRHLPCAGPLSCCLAPCGYWAA